MFELEPFALPAGYGEELLPLADVKAHVGVDAAEDYFDDLIGALRDSAIDMVERYCGVSLGQREHLWRAEALPDRVVLGVRPLVSIDTVAWLDSDGVERTGNATLLRVAVGGVVVPTPGQSWPSMAAGISIGFTAGYAVGACPPALLAAAKMFAAHLFANREAVVTGTISGEIPLGFRMLCAQFRAVVI